VIGVGGWGVFAVLAALPPDVRKAFGFPKNPELFSEAAPES